jgi:dipeptidyl aminopeptidase/acylaminoacyl peptidase
MKDRKTQQQATITEFFKDPSVKYIFTARNEPHRAVVVSNQSGNYQLYAVDFETNSKRQVTNSPQGTLFGSISANGEFIYILDNSDGSEHGHFKRVPFEGEKEINITPEYDNYFAYSVSDSDAGQVAAMRVAMEGKNSILASKQENGVYQSDEVYSTDNSLSEVVCAPNGDVVCSAETISNTEKKLVFFRLQDNVEIKYSKSFQDIEPLIFSANDKDSLLCLTQKEDWQRPCFYSLSTDSVKIIDHPAFNGDIWLLHWNEAGHKMILCDVYQAQQTLYLYSTDNKEIQEIGPKTGSFNFHFTSVAVCDDESIIVRWSDFNTSPQLLKIHADGHDKWSNLPEWSGTISSSYEVRSIHTNSSDKKPVQAWVVRPENSSRSIPFIIDIHGGPHGVTLDEFSPKAQAWLQNGFGYCGVNYRGSISFGKEFKERIYGDPGYWETEDVVAVHDWLVDNEFAQPKQIGLYGWSWGGYVALLALGKYPALWSVGIAGSAISDCIMQYEDEPAYFKAIDKERFEGTPETNQEQYIRSSPITYAENIQAPVLIIHGKNDVRCPPQQIKDFIKFLRENKKDILIKWFESGHVGQFTNTDLRSEIMNESIEFIKNKNSAE